MDIKFNLQDRRTNKFDSKGFDYQIVDNPIYSNDNKNQQPTEIENNENNEILIPSDDKNNDSEDNNEILEVITEINKPITEQKEEKKEIIQPLETKTSDFITIHKNEYDQLKKQSDNWIKTYLEQKQKTVTKNNENKNLLNPFTWKLNAFKS